MLIELSNGAKLSEETVIDALKKQGINVVPKKRKHFFSAGDVAYYEGIETTCHWRFIVNIGGDLRSIDSDGRAQAVGCSQDYFEKRNYKFVGKQRDLLKIQKQNKS